MNRAVQLLRPIAVKDIAGQLVVEVPLDLTTLSETCLSLTLLREQLMTSFVFLGSDRRTKLSLCARSSTGPLKKARLTIHGQEIELLMTEVALDYALGSCLKYYRDGFAEVDHIDIAVDCAGRADPEAYVIMRFADSTTPVSQEDAAKRLGLE